MTKDSADLSPPLNTIIVSAGSLGQCAQEIFRQGGELLVMGVTSKGVYLQDQGSRVCFITQEAFHGPITINLDQPLNFKALFKSGESCRIRRSKLICSKCQVVVKKDSPVWTFPEIRFEKSELPQALHRGADLAGDLLACYEEGLFFPFLEELSKMPNALDGHRPLDLLPPPKHDAALMDRLCALIGFGGGLTPAGDDFICGFLLTRHYLDKQTPPSPSNELHADGITALAHEGTTALSATLIDCAVRGMADERLMNLLRWVALGIGGRSKIKEELRSYGSSSGVDTFGGMLAALLLLQDELG